MRKYKFIYLVAAAVVIAGTACKKQLQVGNPNSPTLSGNVTTETGLSSFTQGATYINGFINGDGWLGSTYWSLPYGYAELLSDNVGADAANQEISVVNVPDLVTMDDGTTLANTSPQIPFLRSYNTRANTGAGNNVYYYQWLNMYALNAAENTLLSQMANVKLGADDAATFKAWAYFWKGFAYSNIGNMYYSGLIIDNYNGSSNHYLVHDSIIARSNYYYNLAITTLGTISSASTYSTVMGTLIPADFQLAPHGGIPTTAAWIRTINTLLARNIVTSKISPFVNGNLSATIAKSSASAMTTADWTAVLNYTKNGIQAGDVVFSGISSSVNPVFSAGSGTVAAMTTGPNVSKTFKITERYIQNFKTGDARLANNFNTKSTYNNPNFTTRWSLIDGGAGAPGVVSYGALSTGKYELYYGASYEENATMEAEANIRLGNTDVGLGFVDAVRKYQGAGIAAVSGTGLTPVQAMTELTKERLASLFGRGLAWYDVRRWGWSYATSNGGGRYGNTFVTVAGKVFTNTTINYNFLDFWDVPADESVLNPPGSGSAATVNPNF